MKKDTVFNIIQQMLAASPEASYKRLNPALRCTLNNCIAADLPFQRDTFTRIYNELRGHWWFGDGAGSHIGEGFYSHAVSVNHASAIQSFEAFAGRPGVLWEETSKSPERLCVGSRFSWKGYYVEVTSMRKDSLVACTYQGSRREIEGIKVGATLGRYDDPHVITSVERDGKTLLIRVVKLKGDEGSRIVARRFTISYAEIAEFRRTEKARLKAVLNKISQCDPAKDAAKLTKEIEAEHFRHFQLEEVRTEFAKRKDWIANEARIQAWRNGANGAWLDVKSTLVRVKGDQVQCSNGNSVSLVSVRRALPIVMDRRTRPGALDLPLDGHRIQSVSQKGAKIGCTLVPWSEIDKLAETIGG